MTFRPAPWLAIHRSLGIAPPPFDDRTISEHVDAHARNRPAAVALQFRDLSITYRELAEVSGKLAGAFKSLGLEKGDVIGIHLPNLPQYMIALVALSRIGAIGSGVSPLLAPSELAYQVRDAGIKALLTLDVLAAGVLGKIKELPACLHTVIVTGDGDHLGKLCGNPAPIAGVNTVRYLDLLAAPSADCPQTSVAADDTFMLQYTGGTTGQPKGAELTLRNLMYNSYRLPPMCRGPMVAKW